MIIEILGENLADKIWEIISSGKLRKLDHLSEDKDTNSIAILSKIWGAGLVTANNWIAQGYRTLDDIREKAELTRFFFDCISYFPFGQLYTFCSPIFEQSYMCTVFP